MLALHRVLDKMKAMNLSYECQLTRARVAGETADIDRLFEALELPIPKQLKVAMYLVHEFEADNFNFGHLVEKEMRLQEEFEKAERQEFPLLGKIGWDLVKEKLKAK